MPPVKRTMQVDSFNVFATSKQVRAHFGMRANSQPLVTKGRKPIPFTLTLKQSPPNTLEVRAFLSSGTAAELKAVIAYLKTELAQFMTPQINPAVIQRIDGILQTYPQNRFVLGMKSVVLHGKTLGPNQESVLADLEARAIGGDAAKVTQLRELVAKNPTNSFLKSVLEQLETGFALSPKQEAAIAKFTPKADPTLEARIQTALEKAKSTYLESLLTQIRGGKSLSPKQLEVLERIENPTTDNPLLSRVTALPPTTFINSLKAQIEAGRPLTEKQLQTLDRIENERAAPSTSTAPVPKSLNSPKSPAESILLDLLSNTNLSPDNQYALRGVIKRLRAGGTLTPDENKAIRYVLYRNQHRLKGSYLGDFKSVVRTIFSP